VHRDIVAQYKPTRCTFLS